MDVVMRWRYRKPHGLRPPACNQLSVDKLYQPNVNDGHSRLKLASCLSKASGIRTGTGMLHAVIMCGTKHPMRCWLELTNCYSLSEDYKR